MNVTKREFPVEMENAHLDRDGVLMTKRQALVTQVAANLDLGDAAAGWEWKGPQGDFPGMWRGRVHGVEVWLRDGVEPENLSEGVTVQVKLKQVIKHWGGKRGDEVSMYLYLAVLPLDESTEPTATVSVVKPPKEGKGRQRRKVLPDDFNEATDYYMPRRGEVSQIVMVDTGEPRRSRAADERDRRVLKTIGDLADVDPDLGRFIAKEVL